VLTLPDMHPLNAQMQEIAQKLDQEVEKLSAFLKKRIINRHMCVMIPNSPRSLFVKMTAVRKPSKPLICAKSANVPLALTNLLVNKY
jgi:hypothetical protein